MGKIEEIIVFTLGGHCYGITLAAVERVVRMVEITPLQGAPVFVSGVINVRGEIVPVVDLRLRLGLPARPVELGDQLLLIRCAGRSMALTADTTQGVRSYRQEEMTEMDDILSDLPFLSGIAKLADSLILIHDLEQLLSPHEAQTIVAAMAREMP